MIKLDALDIPLVADEAPFAIVVADGDGCLKLVNRQGYELLGYAAGELLGRPIETVLPGLHDSGRSLSDRAREFIAIRKDGRAIPIEVGVTVLPAAETPWLVAAVVDVSERARGQEHLEKIIDAAPNAKVLCGEEGLISLVNAEAERLFGYDRLELLGKPLDMLLPDRFRSQHEALRNGYLAAPSTRRMGAGRELYGRRKDGTEISIEIGLGFIETPKGRFVLASINDITERRHLEALRLANAGMKSHNADLEALNGELESFSYTVSHDLRAAVRAIHGYVRILQETCADGLDAEGRRLLGIVQSEAVRMGALIDDILELSRLGRERMRVGLIDMNELVAELVRECERRNDGASIAFEVEALPPAYGDRSGLQRVWDNLISNAVKYSRDRRPAKIHISGESEPDRVVYRIEDNGVGFDMKYAHKLFGVFSRLHASDQFAGTGVGLAIAQRVIVRHHGRIWVDAEVNRGATFSFSLPVVPLRE